MVVAGVSIISLLAGVDSTPIIASAISGALALAAAIVSWWLVERGRRKKGRGTVATSEASDLWEAAEQLRRDAFERADLLEKKVTALEERVNTLMDSNTGLSVQLDAAQRLADQLRDERAALTAEVRRLEGANRHLQRMNDSLTDRVAHLTDLLERHDIDEGGTT